MVFTSQIFLFYFLPLVLGVFYLLPVRGRNAFLTLCSYVFYGWWSPWFVALMLASTVIDWYCGIAITAPGASERQRKAGVFVSIAANLSLLGFFKYFVFAQETLNRLIEAFGGEPTVLLYIVLPVGISFYSFQSMSYSIDLYRGHAERAKNFTDFSCYVSMFPQLVAGPIVRYQEIAEQLHERPQRGELFARGVLNFATGFSKKVLIANTMGDVADLCFGAGSISPAVAWFGVLAYAFQIYFDFSGYSDMAIGLGQMLGFQLPINFRSPYRADSITDFWRRWHVSLSTWLRDYLYIPLGGNRGGTLLTYRNLLLTMLLGGLWHGAQWTFIVWGAIHGLSLAAERVVGKKAFYGALPHPLRVGATFVLVLITWVFFRAVDLESAFDYLGAMFAGAGSPEAAAVLAGRVFEPVYLVVLAVAAAITWTGVETERLVERATRSSALSLGILLLFAFAVVAMFFQAENPFLYFQF
ncbi:Peptidoglycan O-acetyltransferase [Planctomycetes bacterium Pla163]|uniref:Peptidoglycan O-acetyltransferase n=1 Tax=Rohdeia mirabilis TaxID=2528008 RepID=A0A518CXK0_9BACT|nr:Peptidoglycan O-acetyltransferase [Planctomycetes bacterium Pla163]